MDILYSDELLVAVHKPSGLLVHRSLIDKRETRFALQLVRDQIGRRVYPVHRLDKPTSGVLLFALEARVARELSAQFTSGQVRKTYQAIVRGYTDEGPREIVTPFRPIPLDVPEGMKPNEFFNSTENLNDLVRTTACWSTRRACCCTARPSGIPAPSTAPSSTTPPSASSTRSAGRCAAPRCRSATRRLEPDEPDHHRLHARTVPGPGAAPGAGRRGEPGRHLAADLPRRAQHPHAAQPLHGVPDGELRAAPLADPDNPNLTDGGQNSLFQAHMRDVYRAFFDRPWTWRYCAPVARDTSALALTGYPPRAALLGDRRRRRALSDIRFWRSTTPSWGFLDFYRSFFSQVSTRNADRCRTCISRRRSSACCCSTTNSWAPPRRCASTASPTPPTPTPSAGSRPSSS
jgi:hypothetical protein